jgi:hypothetical protein
MYDQVMKSALLCQMEELADQFDVAIDSDEIAAVYRLRETLLAKTMAPLREFDAAGLYQLTHARSTAAFLERSAGLSPGDAAVAAKMARRLGAMPETHAAFVDRRLSSGQVRAIVATVAPRILECYTANEAEIVKMLESRSVRDTIHTMQVWAEHAHAYVDDKEDKPPRDDEFFHSPTLGGRFVSNGSFAEFIGTRIDTALRTIQEDNKIADDKRSPAARRAQALADICSFYLDYRNRTDNDPDAPRLPKKRNHPHLIVVTSTRELAIGAGGRVLDGPSINHQAIEALSCTAQLFRLLLDENGAIRDYQLMPSSVTDALFEAIAARDQGCRWPGCNKMPVHCDVHHLHHQASGGETSPCNCCLFCKYHHHRGAHDSSVKLHLARDGTLTVTYADGTTETTVPPILQPPLPYAF